MNNYEEEMPEGNEELPNNIEESASTGRPVATDSTQVQHQASFLSATSGIIIFDESYPDNRQRRWNICSSRERAVCRILRQEDQLLTEQSNGNSCALRKVARSPRWTEVIAPRM